MPKQTLGVAVSAPKSAITPMMAQFLAIKADYPDALLFYRMGDFYEMFFDDAIQAAGALDIALTKRGKHLGQDIPMCGVPHHASEGYFLTLIRKGYRVAVCEQLESPVEAKKRGSKSVVKRGVVRLVTPGTLTEDSLLNARQHNFLCSFSNIRGECALSWVDISTGDFFVQPCTPVMLGPLLARLAPKEVLISEAAEMSLQDSIQESASSATILARASFDSDLAQSRLCNLFKVKTLDGFGAFTRPELSCLGAIVDYLDITQKGKLPLLRPPVQERGSEAVQIDAATRRNLELTRSLSGEKSGSLLHSIDRTITGAGGRLLDLRLKNPSTDIAKINNRLECVDYFSEHIEKCETSRDLLKHVPDINRAISRLSLERGGPRDLVAVKNGLIQANSFLTSFAISDLPTELASIVKSLKVDLKIIELLDIAINDDPPLLTRDGGFVKAGYHAELDELRGLRDEGRKFILGLQADYSLKTEINSLKIKHNNVLGYFIEVPAGHSKKMLNEPLSQTFIHRQTTANAVRFTTVELSELETKMLNAGGRILEIEKKIFADVAAFVLKNAAQINVCAKALAEIDVHTSFADLAIQENWTRPVLTKGLEFEIVSGRHPVVEMSLRKQASGHFVANDCDLSAGEAASKPVWLLTGPNMAGKSTFLRQNALIAILAQIGSYIPAKSAKIGIVSQIFSRVGASDDLARGQSTFMVEMVETAAILNQAGPHALVILDEIGRGTATYDGLSIAWATLEHLHDVNKCRCLFATHYHELTKLSEKLDGLTNATVTVREWEGDIIFLHEVRKGSADRSYGVQVAKLAGLPQSVIERAKHVLEKLENNDKGSATDTLFSELPLFSAAPAAVYSNKPSDVDNFLADITPDDLSPREALDILYQLKKLE
jgi:DNA mismatch repair protein MutS